MRGAGHLLAAAWRAGRGRAAGTLLLALLAGATECAGLSLLLPLLALAGVGGTAIPGLTLPAALLLFVALVAAGALLERAHGLAVARVGAGVALDLRDRLYAALSRSSWPWFSRLRGSDVSHALATEAERAGSAAQSLLTAAVHGILALAYLAVALAVAPGLVGVAAVAALLGLLAWFRVREARWWGEEISRAGRTLVATADDGMADGRTDRAHGGTEDGLARFGDAAREAARSRLSLFGHLADSRALVTTGAAAVLALFVWVSVAVLEARPAALLLSLFLLNRLFHRAIAAVQQFELAAADLPGLATVEAMTAAARSAEEPRVPAGEPRPLREGIRLEGVSFSYGGPDRPAAVEAASLSIPAGSVTVVTGPSGAGKTTLVDLVAGVLVPDRGRILADGVPLDGSWSSSVGYVAQDVLLLHGTVRSNLLRARPSATEDEVRAALARAGAPGPDRETGERGQALSGGERRRVALARALLRRPSLLVLDGVADDLEVLEGIRGTTTVLLVSTGEAASRRADSLVRVERGRAVHPVPVPEPVP